MPEVRRRTLLAGAAALGGTAAAVAAPGTAVAAPASPATSTPLVTLGPDDPRYSSLTRRGSNGRFVGKPERVHVVSTTEQVVAAVQRAVRDGKRIAVRSGGHCFENFVDDPSVRVLIDTSPMRAVRYAPPAARSPSSPAPCSARSTAPCSSAGACPSRPVPPRRSGS
ncbi:hypothetical protein GTY89_23915, partial [Streptomyces sp. SID5471]|nr:hypothetical protein [Streptomyces sp. SID5471]